MNDEEKPREKDWIRRSIKHISWSEAIYDPAGHSFTQNGVRRNLIQLKKQCPLSSFSAGPPELCYENVITENMNPPSEIVFTQWLWYP